MGTTENATKDKTYAHPGPTRSLRLEKGKGGKKKNDEKGDREEERKKDKIEGPAVVRIAAVAANDIPTIFLKNWKERKKTQNWSVSRS